MGADEEDNTSGCRQHRVRDRQLSACANHIRQAVIDNGPYGEPRVAIAGRMLDHAGPAFRNRQRELQAGPA